MIGTKKQIRNAVHSANLLQWVENVMYKWYSGNEDALDVAEKIIARVSEDNAGKIGHAFNEGYRSRDAELPKSYQKGFKEGQADKSKELVEAIKGIKSKYVGKGNVYENEAFNKVFNDVLKKLGEKK